MSPYMRRRIGEVLRWARANDWRPVRPKSRRGQMYTWTNEVPDPGNRKQSTMKVFVDAGVGWLEVRQRMTQRGWVTIATVSFGGGQTVPDVLAALYVVPHRFSTAYRKAAEEITREPDADPKLSRADSTYGI